MPEAPDHPEPGSDVTLPNAVHEVIEKLATTPAALNQSDDEGALPGGLSDAECVEPVDVVARTGSVTASFIAAA